MAVRAVVNKGRVERAGSQEIGLVRTVRVVTFRTANRLEVHHEMNANELPVFAVMTAQTQRAGLSDELGGMLALMRIVAGFAAVREGSMRILACALLLDIAMTRNTKFAVGCLEKLRISLEMRVVAAHAVTLGDSGVHVTDGKLILEISVTGVTELRALDLESYPCATRFAVARVAGSFFKGHVLVFRR